MADMSHVQDASGSGNSDTDRPTATPPTSRLEFGIVANIPACFHSADLRNYFSQFIESGGFDCFHFRHRPETKVVDNESESSAAESDLADVGKDVLDSTPDSSASKSSEGDDMTRNLAGKDSANSDSTSDAKAKNRTFCCVVRLEKKKMHRFMRMYHKKPWIDKSGSIMASRCFISRIRIAEDVAGESHDYVRRGDSRMIPPDRETFTESHLNKLVELNPPDLMPNGNVGTPTSIFLEYIRTCRLPPRVIQKLGLTFSKTRSNRRYGNVPFAYGGAMVGGSSEEWEIPVTASGQEIRDEDSERTHDPPEGDVTGDGREGKRTKKDVKKQRSDEDKKRDSDSDEDDDDDTCEEWERHESLHEDITSQGRTKERLFEEEIELKWEKGGSGLAFYTDAAFWDAQEGDFDEKTSDDWDVDMSIYYDEHGGDKDARDFISMRKMERMKRGIDDTSVFKKPEGIGQFEKHTKGIGRKVLQKQGWTEGQGLGKTVEGMTDALDNVGQHSRDKTGFGYHGEKLLARSSVGGKKRRMADREVIISTIYDDPRDTDPGEPLMRSRGPHHLKYRHEIEFVKGDRR